MITGVVEINELAYLMSSLLIGTCSATEEEKPDIVLVPTVELDIAEIKNELAVMHQLLERAIANQEV